MYSLKEIRPVQIDDLVRIGRDKDGGYILSQSQVDKTKLMLSFGVCDDWSFEKDFLRHKENVALYAYDYSVSANFFLKSFLRGILLCKFRQIPLRLIKLLSFLHFFSPKKNRTFIKKFVGKRDDERFISVPTIFKTHVPTSIEDLGVFVKMDIEGSEYRVLNAFKPFFSFINGFVIEFHDMDIQEHNFNEIIREMSVNFYIAHVHANNCGGCIDETSLPMILEITFINKKLLANVPSASLRSYPVVGLDFPNNVKLPDIPLVFE
jgi:hypothetical protein